VASRTSRCPIMSEGGWQKAKTTSKVNKPKKKKKGPPTELSKEEEAAAKRKTLVEAGVKGVPLDIKPTMYQRFEIAEAKKRERAAAKDAIRGLAEQQTVADLEAKDAIRGLTEKQGKSKSKAKGKGKGLKDPVEVAKGLNWDEGMTRYENAKVTIPKLPIEWLKELALWFESQFRGCGRAVDAEDCDLFQHVSKRQKERLFKTLLKHWRPTQSSSLGRQPTKLEKGSLALMFSACVDHMVDYPESSVGLLFTIQALVDFELSQNKAVVVDALRHTIRIHAPDFPKDKVVLPILRAYAEVARSPALYLYAWQFLHMQLLLDHSSDNVKSACIKYLKVIIPTGDPKTDKGKATLKALKSELLGVHYRRWAPSNPRVNKLDYEMVPLMAPKQFYKIVQLVFSPTHRQGESCHAEVFRIYPVIRELCIGQDTKAIFTELLPVPSTISPEEQPVQHQVLELLNMCMVRNPEVCFPIIIREHKNMPQGVLNVFQFMLTYVWETQDLSTSQSCPAQLLRTVDTLIAQNNEMRYNPTQIMVDQNYDAEKANFIFQSIRSELSAGLGYLLWTVILITFMAFMVLLLHMMCRFAPLKADVIQPVCSKASDVGMLQAVDAFYVEVEPALQSTITKLQPVRAVFVTLWGNWVWLCVTNLEPTVRRLKDTAGPVVTAYSIQLAQFFETIFGFISQLMAPAWQAAVDKWAELSPTVYAFLGDAQAGLASSVGQVLNGAS